MLEANLRAWYLQRLQRHDSLAVERVLGIHPRQPHSDVDDYRQRITVFSVTSLAASPPTVTGPVADIVTKPIQFISKPWSTVLQNKPLTLICQDVLPVTVVGSTLSL